MTTWYFSSLRSREAGYSTLRLWGRLNCCDSVVAERYKQLIGRSWLKLLSVGFVVASISNIDYITKKTLKHVCVLSYDGPSNLKFN